jgi:hypothetical protein
MASKAKLSGSTGPRQHGAEAEERDQSLHSGDEQEIRHRAYEIYLERGAQLGHDLDDWLQAEGELTTNRRNLRASSAARSE